MRALERLAVRGRLEVGPAAAQDGVLDVPVRERLDQLLGSVEVERRDAPLDLLLVRPACGPASAPRHQTLSQTDSPTTAGCSSRKSVSHAWSSPRTISTKPVQTPRHAPKPSTPNLIVTK